MPTVPKVENRIEQAGIPNVRVNTQAPLEAFGGGQALGQTVQSAQALSHTMIEAATEEKKKADDIAATEAYALAVDRRNRLLYDPKEGVLTRKGKDAFGVVDEYGKRYKDALDEIEGGLKNSEQKLAFQKIRSREATEFQGQLHKHVFVESKAYDDEVTTSGIKAAQADAQMNFHEPRKIQESLALQQRLIQAHAARNGLPEDAVKTALADAESKTHASVINRMLVNGLTAQADQYYSSVKGKVIGDDVARIEGLLEAKRQHAENQGVWGKVGSFRLADGNPDLDRMQNAIYSMKVSPEKQEKFWDYVKTRATEEKQQKTQKDAALTHQFTNDVLQARKNGIPLDKVLEQTINQYGGDNVRRHELSEIAKKLYTTDIKTNPLAYYEVWKSIKKDPESGAPLIKDAFKRGDISGSDMLELLKLTHNEKHREDEFMKGQVVEALKDAATEAIPGKTNNAKQKRAEFLYATLVRSRGKSPEETFKIGSDLLKPVVTQKRTFWFDSKEDGYKLEKQAIDANNAAVGVMHQDLGEAVTDAIGGPAGIDRFLQETGLHYEQIGKGTPVNNAIESLKKNGKAANKKNINAVLGKFKDGIIR